MTQPLSSPPEVLETYDLDAYLLAQGRGCVVEIADGIVREVRSDRACLGDGVELDGAVFFPVVPAAPPERAPRKIKPLTARQRVVLEAVIAYANEHRIPPTMRELAAILGMSINGVHTHIRAIERRGAIHTGTSRARAITICGPNCPVCARAS